MIDFVMPKLGADMTAGKLVAWRKRVGDVVHRGDIVAEVDTDKGVIDVEVFVDGVLERLFIEPGATAAVGTPLAQIRESGEPTPATATTPLPPLTSSMAPAVPPGAVPLVTAPGRLAISPSARRLARELGVDPANVVGTGPGGAITREDVERAAAPRPGAATPPPAQSLSGSPRAPREEARPDAAARMRQAIAAAMSRANREIPHYYLSTTIDVRRALDWLASENARRPVADRMLYGALLLKAVALALRRYPEFNGFWVDGRAQPSDRIHLGVAISLRQGGLIAPALHDADRLSLSELMRGLRDLVERTRTGSLRGSELTDPTITVTNLGEQGVDTVFGVIYPPQVALVGFGRIAERPWVVDGKVVARPLLNATLAGDHRAGDGHRGGRLLAAVDRLMQEPEKL